MPPRPSTSSRYGGDRPLRAAFLPGVLAAVALVVGLGLLGTSGFTVIRYVVSILAIVMIVLALQADGPRSRWWVVPLAVVAVVWNPVVPIGGGRTAWWWVVQLVAAVVMLAAGVRITRSDPDARAR